MDPISLVLAALLAGAAKGSGQPAAEAVNMAGARDVQVGDGSTQTSYFGPAPGRP